MPSSRPPVPRLRRQHHDLPARRRAQHGRNACHGARPADARRWRHLSPRRVLVFRRGWRFHLDGPLVPTVVRRYRQETREISNLQGLESSPARATLNSFVMNLQIDQQRLQSEIHELALITEAEPPVVTRVVFSVADLRARAWLAEKCRDADLKLRTDAVGNTFAQWRGSDPSAPAVGTGSHIDAIPNAGKYDGVVGVLGGLEAIRALQRAGFSPKHSIELLIFTSEEPTRFGIGCLGTRLLAGTLSPESARKFADKDGASIEEVRRQVGLDGNLEQVKLPAGYYKAFVELHIEQGPLLERGQIPLGVVEQIAAPASLRIM